MFETLFGSEMPLAARFFIAFLVVLALIGLTAWLVRRFGANRLGGAGARGRQPRLAVIDAATVDGRRRLVLIRRDNIEHLLMIGGPTDLVVEPNIVRAVGSREVTREPARVEIPARVEPREPVRVEPSVRQTPAMENGWPLQPVNDSTPVPAPRHYRAAATEEPWLAPEPGARARPADSLAGLAAELSSRLNPPDHGPPPVPVRSEPGPRGHAAPAVAHEPAALAQNDHNLAEMAQQLEAALRRAPPPDARPPVTDPLATQASNPQAKVADSPARAPARDFKQRAEPKFESKFEPKLEPKFEPRLEPKYEPKPEPRPEPGATPGRKLYENLEEEMASLLGRPSGRP
jgi:flagellar protein FliO/FliZ